MNKEDIAIRFAMMLIVVSLWTFYHSLAYNQGYYNNTRILSFYPQLAQNQFPQLTHFIPDCKYIHSWTPARCLFHSTPT